MAAAGAADDDGAAGGDTGQQPLQVLAGHLAHAHHQLPRREFPALEALVLLERNLELAGKLALAARPEVPPTQLLDPPCECFLGSAHC